MELYYIIFILINMSHNDDNNIKSLIKNKIIDQPKTTSHCAPGRGIEGFSCLQKKEINEIAKKHNIPSDLKLVDKYSKIKSSTNCKNDDCLKNHLQNKDDIQLTRPVKPKEWNKNPNEWLSSVDIENVLNQYKNQYPNFEFYGPSPIDFYYKESNNDPCLIPELCEFNIAKLLKEGKTKIGIVFNTDPHYKSGQHWISSFLDLEKGHLYFFDSNGINSHLEDDSGIKEYVGGNLPSTYDLIPKLLLHIKKQGNKMNDLNKYKIFYNTRRHQREGSECGMYSIFFIVSMLKGTSFEEFNKESISDKDVFEFRNKFFVNTDKKHTNTENNLLTGGNSNFIDYSKIVNPIDMKLYSIYSKKGIKLLKKYIKKYINKMSFI